MDTTTTTVVIGAGHAGLAMSRRLTERSIDHVVLERGRVANAWRTERWPSLRLLTPNWQTRLPGHPYRGDDPDGFMGVGAVADLLGDYAVRIGAPVRTDTTVRSLGADGDGYRVATDRGTWIAPTVVVASGACNLPVIPALAHQVPPSITTLSPMDYQTAGQLPDGGVLVVGASATGVQLADEIHRSGRPVTLSVGEHVRLPRTYRGRDVFWWMEATGVLGERYDEATDLDRARHGPSPQLIGSPERTTLDLDTLARRGVRIVGRLGAVRDGVAQFSGALTNVCTLADLKMNRLLDRFDDWATASRLDHEIDPPHRWEPIAIGCRPTLRLDLSSGEIRTVIWATGYRPDYAWLDLPLLDRNGRIRHDGGVVEDAPGVYLLGAPLLRRRSSTYIHGAEPDTEDLATHLHAFLDASARPHAGPMLRSR